MGWAKFDDRYSEHPKVVAAGPLAELLDRRAIEYSARQETDGFVPEQQARRLCADLVMDLGADWIEIVKALIEVGRWIEAPGGYLIHDFLDYNPPRAKRDADRQAARERMAAARANKRGRSQDVRANTSGSSGNPVPVPQPVPQRSTPSSTAVDTDDPLRGFEEFWDAWPQRGGRKVGRGKAEERWRKLSLDDRRAAYRGARHYAAASQAGHQGAMDAWRWLRDQLWVDFQEPAVPTARGRPAHAASDVPDDIRHDPKAWT